MTHPIDCFVPSRARSTVGEGFGENQPLALEQRLEGAIVGKSPSLEIFVVTLEGKPGRLFVLKHLRARCDQQLAAYRTFFVGAAGYRSYVFIQPAEMNPDSAPRCDSLYTVSFYLEGDVFEISYRGDFYGNPSSKFEKIWALDWTHSATLGSAIQCAKGVVLPSNFMSGGQTNPVPKATPGSVPGPTTSTSKAAYWVLGAVAVGGLAWWAWSSGALATAGIAANPRLTPDIVVEGRMPTKSEYDASMRLLREIAEAPGGMISALRTTTLSETEARAWIAMSQAGLLRTIEHRGSDFGWNSVTLSDYGKLYLRQRSPAAANPIVTKAASSVWEQAYREALREGLKKGEAEEYAFEVLQAYRADEINRLGGALGSLGYPDDYASNPRKRRVSPAEKAARRIHEAATYLQGRPATIRRYDEPRDLKGPGRERWLVEVGPSQYGPAETFWVYSDHVLGSRRGHAASTRHLYRGDAELASVVDEVDRALELVGARANPGRAQKLGVRPSDVDPKELAKGTKHELEHTDSRKVAARIALDHLAEDRHYYRHLDAMEKKYKGNPAVRIPYALTWVGDPKRRGQTKPGRGDAGWTVSEFPDEDSARDFLRHLDGVAWMPGTRRVAKQLGVRA